MYLYQGIPLINWSFHKDENIPFTKKSYFQKVWRSVCDFFIKAWVEESLLASRAPSLLFRLLAHCILNIRLDILNYFFPVVKTKTNIFWDSEEGIIKTYIYFLILVKILLFSFVFFQISLLQEKIFYKTINFVTNPTVTVSSNELMEVYVKSKREVNYYDINFCFL